MRKLELSMMFTIAASFAPDAPLLTALLIAALVLILATSSSSKKRPTMRSDGPHTCRGCGTVHPQYANFCRRCGERLL